MGELDFLLTMVGNKVRFHELGLDRLTQEELGRVQEWLLDLLVRHSGTVEQVDEVRADGHLVRLSDGSLWEVDSPDAATVEFWSPFDDVAIIDGRMYRVDASESAAVERVDS